MIAPLHCNSCQAPLAIVDAPSLVCSYCGAVNRVPDEHREALRLAQNLDEASRRAASEWARLHRIRVPRWWCVGSALAPLLLVVCGLAAALAAGFLRPESRPALPLLVGLGVWLPLAPIEYIATRIGMRNLLVSGAAYVGAAFAASAPATPGAPHACRQCGAPLSAGPDDVVVRCLYCGAESLVGLDTSRVSRFETRVASAKASLAEAMKAVTDRAALASFETFGRMCIIASLLVLPLGWSVAGTWAQASSWSLFIALDVWVLGICVFWYVRESLLPPVTIEALKETFKMKIEELDARVSAPDKAPGPQTPGTRGWYDSAFDAVNFVIPAGVALLFLALEVVVLLGFRRFSSDADFGPAALLLLSAIVVGVVVVSTRLSR